MRFASNNDAFSNTQLIVLKDHNWFEKQKFAGSVVATCLKSVKSLIEQQTPNLSLKDLEAECEKIMEEAKCIPTFKNYKGFPGSICTSVNNCLVHGIPTKYMLQPGDVVSIDIGATFDGVIGDAAITCIYGAPKHKEHTRLIDTCWGALYAAIKSVVIGNQIGCIGDAIHNYVKTSGFHLITNYGGHGLAHNTLHAQPFVPNKSKRNEGIRIQHGLSIAIEPMLAIGSAKTITTNDGWTVKTKDISAHVEHTIFVGEDRVHVMTEGV